MAIGLVRKKWAVALVLVRALEGATECASDKIKYYLCAGLPLENGRAWRSGFLLLNRIAWSTTILIDLPSGWYACVSSNPASVADFGQGNRFKQWLWIDLTSSRGKPVNEWRWIKKSLWLKQLADLLNWESQACQHAPYLCSRLPGSLRDAIGIGLSKWPISRCMYSWSAFLIVPFPGIDWEGIYFPTERGRQQSP